MSRAFILVLDSFGIGASADAGRFGDTGADTYGHIRAAMPDLALPNLKALGLDAAHDLAAGRTNQDHVIGLWGYAQEQSAGKDTPSGHWEMAGCPVNYDWHMFPNTQPAFPPDLIATLIEQGQLPGVLGDCHASGTEILDRLGAEHMATGKPIIYTSADSVFQIAAHEGTFGLKRLYDLCVIARRLVDPLGVGRVIARPFIDIPGGFKRTANRKDLAVPPPAETLLDRAKAKGREVIGIGKIADIFAHQGITQEIKADGNDALVSKTIDAIKQAPDGSLVLTNLVDFDSLYGHRRDPLGYGRALGDFDRRWPELNAHLKSGDIVILTADHGCDPTFRGTDHTREYVPVLGFGPGLAARGIGQRTSFADIGQSLSSHLGLGTLGHGISFLS
jgi:phosphopentomutase